jgi:hypothetical protein
LAGGARETDELILEFLLVRHFSFTQLGKS